MHQHTSRGGSESIRWHDDLFTRVHADGNYGSMQRGGRRIERDCVLHVVVRGELVLKLPDPLAS